MKILFFSENFPPETNAAATRVFERACYWVKWGHEVTVLTSAPNFPEGKLHDGYKNCWHFVEIINGIRVVRVKTYIAPNQGSVRRVLDFISFMVTAFISGLFEKRPDVIVATSPQFFAAVGGWALGFVRRLPFVFELGDLWPASIAAVGAIRYNFALRMVEHLELFLYNRSASIVALTGAFKVNLVSRGIPSDKIAIVLNGVDLWRYGPRSKDKKLCNEWKMRGKFVIGYIGTHGMAHALTNILDAAEILQNQPNILFFFVGAGAEKLKLMREAEQRNLKNVIFLPVQPKTSIPLVWSLCDVALVHLKDSVVFSHVIPSKIFEAMAMGLPILVASPDGEASNLINKHKAGIHVPAENPKALAQAVEKLHSDSELRASFSSHSFRSAQIYSREKQALSMILILENVISGKGENIGNLGDKTGMMD